MITTNPKAALKEVVQQQPSDSLRRSVDYSSESTKDITVHQPVSQENFEPTIAKIDVSIVIPLLNEVKNLEILYSKLTDALDKLEQSSEIIFIDDGSTDGSFELLKKFQEQDNRVRVIRFRRNFGQTAAFSAGFDYAQGEVIITMDADLQNDPVDIPLLLAEVDKGYDVVSGWRINRQDTFVTRKIPSQMANFLISRLTGVQLHDYGCSLKAYRKDVVKNIRLYGELHRFIPALASWMGVTVSEVPVNHHARKFGQSKYGLGRIIKVMLDLMTVKFLLDYATRPIQIFGFAGLLSLIGGGLIGFYLTVLRLVFFQPLGDRPILLLAILLVVLGVQLIIMGLLGEMIIRTYHETQDKPIYMVRETLGTE
ncbi:MAG: glycosyltransferase family 2 protein [Anaerolineae bacterium]|nr:glycosyltransferase family 2 protein [Anaerolineae bacterium]